MHRFEAARWPVLLRAVSALATLVLAAGWLALAAVPESGRTGPGRVIGLLVWMPPAVLAGALLYIVRWYEIEGRELRVGRLLWTTRLDLTGLRSAELDPAALRGSIRLFGNGGLFAFTGLYRNETLGRYRLFATDTSKAVVLKLPSRTIVVTPSAAAEFAAKARTLVSG